MTNNLAKGRETQNQQRINIGNPLQQKIKSVNYNGILVENIRPVLPESSTKSGKFTQVSKIKERFASPYISYSLESGKFEYTEARVHMSEDLFWYHIYKTYYGE